MISRSFFVFLVSMILCACTKNGAIENQGPNPKIRYVDPSFNISGMHPGDTLEIYGKTAIFAVIKSQSPVIEYSIVIEGDTTKMWYGGRFYIIPKAMDDQCHVMIVTPSILETPSWTSQPVQDSVFEIAPSMKEFKYVFKYVSVVNQKSTLKKGKSPDDYLMLSWENPGLKHAEVSRYEIFYRDWYQDKLMATLNADQTFFVDSGYVMGSKEYMLKTHFKDDIMEPWQERIAENMPYLTNADVMVEELPGQKIKISWTKPDYRCSYKVNLGIVAGSSHQDNIINDLDYHTNYFVTEAPAFPFQRFIRLNYYTDNENKSGYGELSKTYESGQLLYATPDLGVDPRSMFAYSQTNKNIYIVRPYNVEKRDLSLGLVKNVYIRYLHYIYDDRISCSPDGSKVAVFKTTGFSDDAMDSGFVILDQDLTVIKNFKVSSDVMSQISHNNNYFIGIDNSDRVMLLVNDCLYVYDATDGSPIYSQSFPDSPYLCKYVFSEDSRYVCQYTTRDIKVFDITGATPNLILTKNFSMLSKCLFTPDNSGNLYIEDNKQIQRLSVLGGNSNSSSIPGELICIDPVTGHVAYKTLGEGYFRTCYIVTSDLAQTIVRFDIDYNYDVTYPHPGHKLSLYNNLILASTNSQIRYTNVLKYKD